MTDTFFCGSLDLFVSDTDFIAMLVHRKYSSNSGSSSSSSSSRPCTECGLHTVSKRKFQGGEDKLSVFGKHDAEQLTAPDTKYSSHSYTRKEIYA